MNKKLAITAVAAVVVVGAAAVSVLGSENALFEQYPDIDPKVVVKAHRKMLFRTITGQYGSDLTDEQCETIFLALVQEITTK